MSNSFRTVLTPHHTLSHAFAKASARRPRRGNPSVACLKVRESRASSAEFGGLGIVRNAFAESRADCKTHLHAWLVSEGTGLGTASPLTPALSPLRGEGVALDAREKFGHHAARSYRLEIRSRRNEAVSLSVTRGYCSTPNRMSFANASPIVMKSL